MSESLSEKIAFFRVERPSEWLMDEFKRDAEALEQRIKELEQENERLLNLASMDTLNTMQKKRDLEQQAEGIIDAAINLASPYGAIPVDALHEYGRQLYKQAEELK